MSEVWWCKKHKREGNDSFCSRGSFYLGGAPSLCRMVKLVSLNAIDYEAATETLTRVLNWWVTYRASSPIGPRDESDLRGFAESIVAAALGLEVRDMVGGTS